MKRVLFRPQAARDLERLPNRNRDQVEEAIERFAQTGSGDIKMLAGEGRQLRLRVGDWRIRFEALRNDVKPVADGAVALESDAKDSWDDVYWDVKALVGSATVAARGVAETSEAVGKAAPKLAESAVGIGKSTDAIAADVHTATSDFVKPKTFWQRLKAWLETAGKVGARFL
jgi:mRNA-degrading endonuclease RelE of RelBE toxin-antitoxin system